MFSHIKAKEYVNLLEGLALPAGRRAHLDKCARCSATWQSLQSTHAGVSELDSDIPEPDWSEFRSSVRDELLSRSVQRASAVRRWTGWPLRPAAAWALSLLLAVGITSATLLWWVGDETPVLEAPAAQVEPVTPLLEEIDFSGVEEEIQLWSQKGLFDEIARLEEKQQEQLRQMLQTAQEEMLVRE